MNINQIVQVTILPNARGVSKKTFGLPIIFGYHTNWADKSRIYNTSSMLEDLQAEGFNSYDPIVLSAKSLVSANPKPILVEVGRLENNSVTSMDIKVVGAVFQDAVFAIEVGIGDVLHSTEVIAQSGDTATDVASALATALDSFPELTALASGDTITVESVNADDVPKFEVSESLAITNNTVAGTLVADITAVGSQAYAWILADNSSSERVLAIAGLAETLEVLYVASSQNSGELDGTGIGHDLKQLNYMRTALIFGAQGFADIASAWAGTMLAYEAGEATWAYKFLAGISASEPTSNQQTALATENVSYYEVLGGLPVTIGGKTAGGEWIDVVRFRDWLVANIREDIFSLLASVPKIPYTDGGIQTVVSTLDAVLSRGVLKGGLADDPEYTIDYPNVTEVPQADKQNRLLPDVYFEATLAGAIHIVTIKGALKV